MPAQIHSSELTVMGDMELPSFLLKAKKATWAGEGVCERLSDGGKRYSFRSGRWSYEDTYHGYLISQGRELVLYGTTPVWGMVYVGRMIAYPDNMEAPDKRIRFAHDVFEFLKSALEVPDRHFPVRGPHSFEGDGPFKYTFDWGGDLRYFDGKEHVWWFPPDRPDGMFLSAGGNPGKAPLERIVFTQNVMGGLIVGKNQS